MGNFFYFFNMYFFLTLANIKLSFSDYNHIADM